MTLDESFGKSCNRCGSATGGIGPDGRCASCDGRMAASFDRASRAITGESAAQLAERLKPAPRITADHLPFVRVFEVAADVDCRIHLDGDVAADALAAWAALRGLEVTTEDLELTAAQTADPRRWPVVRCLLPGGAVVMVHRPAVRTEGDAVPEVVL